MNILGSTGCYNICRSKDIRREIKNIPQKLPLVKSKNVKYNNFVCIADSSVLCGAVLTIFARHCSRSVRWYTVMSLKSHLNVIRFNP